MCGTERETEACNAFAACAGYAACAVLRGGGHRTVIRLGPNCWPGDVGHAPRSLSLFPQWEGEAS